MNINIENNNLNRNHDLYDYAFVFLCLSEIAKNEHFLKSSFNI